MKHLRLASLVAVVLLCTGCIHGQGPFSMAKTMSFQPDMEVVQIGDTMSDGTDSNVACVMRLKDLREIRFQRIDITSAVTVRASGPLKDRLTAAGPGQLMYLNGENEGGEFLASEIVLPTSKLDQDIVAAAIRYAAAGVCGGATQPAATIEPEPAITRQPGEDRPHLIPTLAACNETLANAKSDMFRARQRCSCEMDDEIAAIYEYFENYPVR